MTIPTVSWDETSPAGSDNINLGDNRIREMKTQVREVMAVDHNYQSSGQDATAGQHKQVTLVEAADIGTGATGVPILGAQTTDGAPELVYTDEADNDVVITDDGAIAVLGSEGWRSGDMLLSSSTSTPTGWTDVSTTYDDTFIRIGNGTPLTSGGSDTHDHGAASGSYTLLEADIPAHTHTIATQTTTNSGGSGDIYHSASTTTGNKATGSYGGGGSHAHSISSVSNVPAYIELRMYKKT